MLSVIIPTLNEGKYLPGLLEALNQQTCRPDEIIVADAGSRDDTVEQARAQGAQVVRGGMPAAGRNAGARVATGTLLQFFDADVLPQPDFIARALGEFNDAGYAVATCLSEPLSADPGDRIITDAANLMIQILQPIAPHAPGYCILARREVHEAMGGFDESLKMSEDHDYVRRASQYGEFGILTSVRISVSMRRLDKEGLPSLALKYLWCEMQALEGKPIRSTPFEYQFGAFKRTETETGRSLIDIAELRTRLGSFDNPLERLSRASVGQLKRLAELSSEDAAREPVRLRIEPPDLDTLEQYLQQRLRLMRENQESLNQRWAKFKIAPHESIRLLGPNGLHRRRADDVRREQGNADA
jgi:glycosyltransferase involved in cell wall biosynthesis